MKRFCHLVTLLCFPLVLHAQVTLRGTVVDQKSGTALSGVQVSVTGATQSAATNSSGAFTLTSAKAITSVTATRSGYTTKVVPVSGGEVRIELVATAIEIPGIQVVASRPEPSPGTLTKSDLSRFDGLGLLDPINTLPGVFMQTRTPFGGAHIDIRGYYPSLGGNSPNSNGTGANVFLNGIPVTDASGVSVLDDVDFATLGSVQIIKGPASSLYGSAIGGTVLFNTARPTPNTRSVGEQFLTGADGLMRSNASLVGANSSADYVVNYGEQRYNSWRDHSASRKTYVRATGNYQVGASQTLGAYFSYNKSYEELAGEIDSTDYASSKPVSDANYIANNSHIQITSFLTGVADHSRLGEHFTNQTSVFANGRFSNQPFAHGFTDATQFTLGARSVFGYSGQMGHIGVDATLGAMAQRTNVTSNGVFIVPAPPYTERPSATQNFAVNEYLFTEWRFAFSGQVTVTAGGSYIKNAFTVQNMLKSNQLFDTTAVLKKSFDAVFAPRLTIAKGFSDNALVYASVSTGYTPPLLSNSIANNGTVDSTLKPEHATQYEVGVQGKIIDRLSAQVAAYDLDNTDKLVSQTVATVTSVTNAGKVRYQGAELSLSWLALSDNAKMLSMVRPWASFTYNDAKYISFKSDNNNATTTVDFSGKAVARVPKTRYAVGIDAGTKNGFSLNSTYQFVDKVPLTFDNSNWINSYSLLSAKVGYHTKIHSMWNLDLAAGGDNLLGNNNYNFIFVGPNYKGLAQAQDGGTGDGYILPGNPKAHFFGSVGLSYIIK